MDVIIRSATEQDVRSVAALVKELAEESEENSPINEYYAREYLASGGAILLAEVENQVVGLLSYSVRPNLYHAGDCYLIEELVITRTHRNRGVGQVLVAELVDRAEQSGYAEITVSTLKDNVGAIRFYRKLGFTAEGLLLERHWRG